MTIVFHKENEDRRQRERERGRQTAANRKLKTKLLLEKFACFVYVLREKKTHTTKSSARLFTHKQN